MPIEICLSSNVICGTVATCDQHHLGRLLATGHPVALCTDDMGVFAAPLSHEYALAARTFGLSNEALAAMSQAALQWAFVDSATRAALQARFQAEITTLLTPAA